MGWTANTSAPDSVTTIAMNYPGGGEGNVLIAVGNNATTVNYWLFDNTGNLRLPGNTFAVNYANGTQVSLGGGNVTWSQIDDKSGNGGPTIIALGQNAGFDGQGNAAIAIGKNAGQGGQGDSSITIGEDAGGNTTQGANAVAIGRSAGFDAQGEYAVAIGQNAGYAFQGLQTVAVGLNAGSNTQSNLAVAIGVSAGSNTQGDAAVAIGASAGFDAQGNQAVAIGTSAGQTSQGTYAVAIGSGAGANAQGNNSIILNATGANLNQTTANTFTVSPVRNDTSNIAEVMFYNATSKEVTYGNTISIAGNANVGNLNTTTAIITTGNITTINSGLLQNGNSNITLTANGNVSIQAAGSNVELVVTSTGANVTGTLNATGNITGNFFIGNGSQLTSVTAVNANVSLVSNNQEYSPLLATNTTGNLPFKASGGISWNPSTYGLTAGKILLGTGIGAQGVTGTYAFGANTAWKVQSQNGTNTDAQGQEIGRFGSEYTSGATTFWDSYTSYYQGSGASSGWMILNAAGNSVANVTGTGIAVTGTLSANGNVTVGNLIGPHANGNSNVNIATANGNVTITAVGNTTMTVTGTGANITGTLNATGNITGSYLISAQASGDEGGEISLAQPPNGNLSGGITIDAYQNTLRMFEQGGTARGLSVDIANSPAGGGTAIGYRDIPQVAAGNVTLAATDAGKHYYSTTAGNLTLTIPLNSSVPFTTGTAISIVVQAAGNVLVNAASGVTLYMAGNSTAANRVVGGYGMATLMKVASDTWFINGAGVA
jgi:hypothetical protein